MLLRVIHEVFTLFLYVSVVNTSSGVFTLGFLFWRFIYMIRLFILLLFLVFASYAQEGVDTVYIGYYESGAINSEYPHVDGKLHGTGKVYYESGALGYEAPYVDGKLHGTRKWYYESGGVAGTARYVHGVLDGYMECSDGRKGNERLNCLYGF